MGIKTGIRLGMKVRDRVTGYTGAATRKMLHLDGLVTVEVYSQVTLNGKQAEPVWFDIRRLERCDNAESASPVKAAQ
jgi:hypothetical protein